jgi:hypothetical protein
MAHGRLLMSIASVEAGLAAVERISQLVERHCTLAKPELTLRRTAGEDHVGEFVYFLAQGRI